MKPLASVPDKNKGKFVRPASIVIRFSKQTAYGRAVTLYSTLVDPNPDVTDNGTVTSFQVGASVFPKRRDIELRLELHKDDTSPLKDRTIVCWEIKPHLDEDAIQAVKEQLISRGYNPIEQLGRKYEATEYFMASDDDSNLFGGHPNPHFPPGIFASASGLLGKVLTGLALGTLVLGGIRLFRGQRR